MRTYGIHSRDYLRRARQRLNERTQEALFYTALELRCGIEARMHQYLEARTVVSKKKRRGWKVAKLARNLEAAFQTGDKVVEFAILPLGRTEATAFYYTPVSSKLRRMADRLGDYMHAMRQMPPSNDWWAATRDYLEEVFEELYKANAGTLLGPPLLNAQGKVDFLHELLPNEDAAELSALLGKPADTAHFHVRYLDAIPENGA